MEHILQFGVSIDDEAIKKSVIDNVTRNVSEKLEEDIDKILQGNPYSYWNRKDAIEERIRNITGEFCEEHKEEIIDKCAVLLCEKLIRTKKVKEMLDATLTEINK